MDALTPETMRIIWLLLVVILLVIELITVGLTTIWFAGAAVYDGQEWTARSVKDDGTIEAGKYAVVEKIEGVKLIVREKEEK